MSKEPISEWPCFASISEMLDWAMKVRMGEIKTTPEIRQRAKMVSHAQAYGREFKVQHQ